MAKELAKVQDQILYNEDVVKPRALTRKENRQFRESGFHPTYPIKDKKVTVDEFSDYILDNFYPNVNFDSVGNDVIIKFASEVIAMTYGQGAAETKN